MKDKTIIIIEEIKRCRDGIEKTQEDVVKIKVTQAKNTAILDEHMRRTEANENRIEKMENFKWYFGGISAILVAISSFVSKYL